MKYFSICLIFLALWSCKKEEVVPPAAAKTKTELLLGKWLLSAVNDTIMEGDLIFEFKNNNQIDFFLRSVSHTEPIFIGQWQWASAETKIIVTLDTFPSFYDVLHLDESQLRLRNQISEKWTFDKQ